MTETQQRLDTLDAQAKFRIAFLDCIDDGRRRFIAPGLQMQVSYPSLFSIQVLLRRKRQELTLVDITVVRKRLEAQGWTLSSKYEGKGFWEGTFI